MTLTETALLTKKILLFSGIFLSLAIFSWLGYRYYYYNIYLPSLPPVEEKPDIKFGILPQINLLPSKVPSSEFSYTLDTTTGELPQVPKDIPKIKKVYFSPQLGTTLLAPDRAKELAGRFDFKAGPRVISPTQYSFTDEKEGELIIDLNNGNFKYRRALASESANLKIGQMKEEGALSQDFKNFLSSKGLLKDELINGVTKVSYNKPTLKESTQATISLWQDKIEGTPAVTDNFSNGLIKATITTFFDEKNKFPELDYIFWPLDLSTYSTYPLRSPEEAFEDLKEGLASVVIEPQSKSVSLTKIYLAYLFPQNYSPYIQPVYVFEGDNFASLVPAISPHYLNNPN